MRERWVKPTPLLVVDCDEWDRWPPGISQRPPWAYARGDSQQGLDEGEFLELVGFSETNVEGINELNDT